MLQTVFIRENREKVIQALGKRNFDATALVDEVIALDEKRRHTQVELDTILSESNKQPKHIGELRKPRGGQKLPCLKKRLRNTKIKVKN